MDLTSALMAYDEVISQAEREGRQITTADKLRAMKAAIEAYEGDKANVSALSDEEIDVITWREHPDGICTVSSLREIGRAVEAEVARRFRAQGGITSPKKDNDAR